MKKFYQLKNWDNYNIPVNHEVFSTDLLKSSINKFWKEIVETKLNENQHILFLFRLQWSNNQFATIGNLQKLNLEDKDYLLDLLVEEMRDKSEYYQEQSIVSVSFSYGIRDGKAMKKVISTGVSYQNFYHHKFPLTMDPLQYGKLIRQQENVFTIQINDTNIAIIIQHGNKNEVEIYRKGLLVYKYTDVFTSENGFIREIGNKKFHITDNEIRLLTVEKPVKFMQGLKKGRKASK